MRYVIAAALSLLAIHCVAKSDSDLGDSKANATDGTNNAAPDTTATASSSGSTTTPEADAGPAPKPDPILDFAFNPTSGQLSAMVLTANATGATLKMSIIPIETGDEDATIDCDTAVTLSNGVVQGKYTVFPVPSNSRELSQRLDGETRTAIQGCLSDGAGKSIVSMQTSLYNAWDNDPTTKAASPRIYHGVEAYTNDCMADMGDLPMFAGDADFDCMDPQMHVVPITATSTNGTVTTLDENTTDWPLSSAEQAATRRCDRPAWLGYDGVSGSTQCAPFSRIGSWTNTQGTHFVLVCRRYATRALSDPQFDDINFIANNPTTGKTCFFNSHLGGTSDGTKIPAPDTTTADKFWLDPAGVRDASCANCHDSGPFMHSPWVDQVVDPTTTHTIVPRIQQDPAYTATMPYSIFSVESFATDQAAARIWHQPEHLDNVGSCGSCHRIGNQATAELWAARAVGDDETIRPWMTNAFLTSAKLQWMPADPNSSSMIEQCGQEQGSCASAADTAH